MSTNYNPQIVTSGLVLAIDAANPKSYDTKHNLTRFSQDWTQGVQSIANVTITAANTTAPDGTLTGQRITTTQSGYVNDGFIQKLYSSSGRNIPTTTTNLFTFSTYVKQGTSPRVSLVLSPYNGSTYKDLIATLTWSNLAISIAGTNYGRNFVGLSSAANGWYRLSCTTDNTFGATDLAYRIHTRDHLTNNITGEFSYIWGSQLEYGNTPGPYILTTTSPILRSNNVVDLVNNNQNILFANNMAYSANNGNYFSFDGVSAIGCCNTMAIATGGSSNVTQEALLYIRSTSGNPQTIFTRGQTAVAFNYGMVISATSNRLCFRNSSADTVLQSDSLSTSTWYHLVISTTPSGSTGYVNGVQKNTVANTTSFLSPSNNFWTIGCRPSPGPAVNENFFGEIALFRVYQGVAFTPEQVLQNFNSLRGRYNL